VPQWYQKGFTSERENELRYLRRRIVNLTIGPRLVQSAKWYAPSQCFSQSDLYTTVFGSGFSDEIERKLFGLIDDTGSKAVKAFLLNDQSLWREHFKNFFVYLDAQKLRTPKGLDWVRSKYPTLSQNELMLEMQALRTLHCTLWAEGVREFVSARDSDVKFIFSDHPVTIYNYACPPDSDLCQYPNDPDIALKGSQTIFPLDENRCLILTNLEYAQDPKGADPLELRTNATKVRQSMVNTIEFINNRELTAEEVTKINCVIKSRSRDSIAAGRHEWLYPDDGVKFDWAEIREVLLPEMSEISFFGGEMYAKFEDGSTHYQDAFGRTTPKNDHLGKSTDENSIGRNDPCGCGSGRKYKLCCEGVSDSLRPTWAVMSIRERNLAFCRAIAGILDLDNDRTWAAVRLEITDKQISEIYGFYAHLWPRDTDIYSMLPKSDNKFRALYTGILDVRTIGAYALGMASHFDEFLIESPITNPNNVRPKFSPTESPGSYKYQALKEFSFMLGLEPLIGVGLVNLIPDPAEFDQNLQQEMMGLAEGRHSNAVRGRDQQLHFELAMQDLLNASHPLPTESKVRMLMSEFGLPEELAVATIAELEASAENEQLVLLQPDAGTQFMLFRMGPNFEMALFIAQVTGSVLVTDSESRWLELQKGQHRSLGVAIHPWSALYARLNAMPLDYESVDTFRKSPDGDFVLARRLLKGVDGLVQTNDRDVTKIEKLLQQLTGLSERLTASNLDITEIEILSPEGGIYDKTVQRLLVRSGCPRYDDNVRSIYYVGLQL